MAPHLLPEKQFTDRKGAEKDKELIVPLLEKKGVTFQVYEDFTAAQIKEVITQFSDDSTEHFSAFIFVMSSHGKRGLLYGRDAEPVDIRKEIMLPFGKCKSLTAKPKIFLLQGCQELPHGDTSTPLHQHLLPDGSKPSHFEDMCVALPQTTGFRAFRHPNEGSILLLKFNEVVQKYGDSRDIVQLLTKVNKETLELTRGERYECVTLYESTLKARFFFGHNVSVNIQKLLRLAADTNNSKILDTFNNLGVIINNEISGTGKTALMMASENGHVEMVEALIKNGADVNRVSHGTTPLLVASENGHADVVSTLINHKADGNVRNNKGDTPLMIANRQNHGNIVEMLTNAGFTEECSEDEVQSLTVIKTVGWIDSVCTDSQNLLCAATVMNRDKDKLTVRLWRVCKKEGTDVTVPWEEEDPWEETDVVVIHTLNLEESPEWAEVTAIMQENMLLLHVRLDGQRSQFLVFDTSSECIQEKSDIHACGLRNTYPTYCCYSKQILILGESSITHLALPELQQLFTWSHERVQNPWTICSNKDRLAIQNMSDVINVFSWTEERPSRNILHQVRFSGYCTGIQVLSDNSLMAINVVGQWSVWREDGTLVHNKVDHPTLMTDMKINPRFLLQDPVSRNWFVQEYGKLQDTIDCKVIYNLKTVMQRLETGDKSHLPEISEQHVNKTLNFASK